MIAKFIAKRSGAVLIDVLIALTIFTFGIIPVIGTISYLFHSVVESGIISRQYNEFNDYVGKLMLEHMINPVSNDLGTPSGIPDVNIITYDPILGTDQTITARIMVVPRVLSTDSRKIPVRIYMIQK